MRTTARPIATRWRWPPDSSDGRRSSSGSSASMRAASVDARVDLGARPAFLLQAQFHVAARGQVGIERVGLEHHGDAALGRRHDVDHAVVDQHMASGVLLQPRDDAQQGGLAAARRADEHHELAVGDVEIDALEGFEIAERLAHAL